MAKGKTKKVVQSSKKKSSNTASKKTSSTKSNINTKKSSKNQAIVEEKNYNKLMVIVAAIVILVIILLSIFGCENKNDVEKLQGNVNKEEINENETQNEVSDEDKVKEKNEVVFEKNKETFYVGLEDSLISDTEVITPVVSVEDEEKTKLDEAREAVEKAEETLDKDDILTADDLVENLEDSDEKEELEERLDEIKEVYNVKASVERLEKLTKEAEDKEDVRIAKNFRDENEIIEQVEDIENEEIKEELQKRLEDLEPILDDTTAPIITNVEEGVYYNTKVKPGVIEENIRSIKVNDVNYVIGQELEDGMYTIVVVDMAFNDASCTFVIDTTKPELTLVGEENITLEYNKDAYEEKGALYSDNIDGDKTILAPTTITKDSIEVASVDNKIVGKYILTYEVSDTAGNINSVVRVVEVKDTVLPEAKATVYVIDGKYIVKLTEISEELLNDGTWTDNAKIYDILPENIIITDVNGNTNVIIVKKENNLPQININTVSKEDYKNEYSFDITDESDIEIVKIAHGAYVKEYFGENGDVLAVNSYIAYKNGDYTIYAKDKLGNEAVKTFTVDNIKSASISLNGTTDIVLEYKKDVYIEEGATYYNNVNAPGYISVPTKITKDDVEVSSVDTNSVGIYKLEYSVTDLLGTTLSVVRTVTVKDTIKPTAKATAYMVNGKFIVKLSEISEEIQNDGTWADNTKLFDELPVSIIITDINNNTNEIIVNKETNGPVITEKVTNSDLYSKNYNFEITDQSDIEIVKINGVEIEKPYNYSIYQNGNYTVYAKDALGNETTKELIVSDIIVATITDEELRNAFIEGKRVCSGIDCEKTMTVNSTNTFEIIEIKYISTTAKDTVWPNKEVTVDSFKANKINGSDVVVLLLPLNEFKIKHENAGIDSRYYYIYYKVEKGTGTNKVIREYVIEVEPADGLL